MEKTDYNFEKIEKKWQKKWEKEKIFEVKENQRKRNFMFLKCFLILLALACIWGMLLIIL